MAYLLTHDARLSAAQLEALRQLAARLDLRPGPGGARITPLGPWLPEAVALLGATVPAGRHAATVIALTASQQIPAHCDPPMPGRRFHYPLALNPFCWVFHGGVWQQLEEGGCYEMDPTVVHGAVNWGHSTRLHLILDTVVC